MEQVYVAVEHLLRHFCYGYQSLYIYNFSNLINFQLFYGDEDEIEVCMYVCTGLFAATPPSMRLYFLELPLPSRVVNLWPGRNVGAADVLMHTSESFAFASGDFLACPI